MTIKQSEKECKLCSTKFVPTRRWQDFCSQDHRTVWHRNLSSFAQRIMDKNPGLEEQYRKLLEGSY